MIYYIISLFLILLSFITEAKLSKELSALTTFCVFIVLVIFVGLRGDIEGDYASYKDIFQQSFRPYSATAAIEPGYYYLNHAIILLRWPFQVLVFLMAVFSLAPKMYFFNKYSPNLAFSVLIYYCNTFFIFDFIQIRQAVTIGVFMCCLPFIYERRFWPFFLCMLLAAFIHVSTLLLIPVYFLLDRTYSKKFLYAVIAVCGIITVLQIKVPLIDFILSFVSLPGFTEGKANIYLASTDFSIVSYKQLFLGVLFVFIRDKFEPNNKMINALVNVFVVGIFLATLLNGMSELSFRIKWYFFWAEAILMVYAVKYFAKQSLTITYTAYTCLFVLYVYSLNTLLLDFASRDQGYIFPYKFFFQ
jgi:hypothetical protein